MHIFELPPIDKYKQVLFKTEICDSWRKNNGKCKYGDRCKFAHGTLDLREVPRHPKYKTEICRKYYFEGVCPYGARCSFLHDEHEKLYAVDSSSQLKNSSLPFSFPDTVMPNYVNAPVFAPHMKTNGEEHESVYADSNYTDSLEMFHDVLSDSGFEHSALSDSEIEPFIRGGFTDAKTFLKQHADLCNYDDDYGETDFSDFSSTETLNGRTDNGRLPIFAMFTGSNGDQVE